MKYAFSYLLDENLNATMEEFLSLHHPDLPFHSVGDRVAPPTGTLDPSILNWCEDHGCILVTDNRKSMPRHLKEHLDAGRHIEGIFQVGSMTVVELGEHLVEIAEASFPGEYRDVIHYLPLY